MAVPPHSNAGYGGGSFLYSKAKPWGAVSFIPKQWPGAAAPGKKRVVLEPLAKFTTDSHPRLTPKGVTLKFTGFQRGAAPLAAGGVPRPGAYLGTGLLYKPGLVI